MIGDGNPDSLWFRRPNGFQQTVFQIGQKPDFSVSWDFHWTAIPPFVHRSFRILPIQRGSFRLARFKQLLQLAKAVLDTHTSTIAPDRIEVSAVMIKNGEKSRSHQEGHWILNSWDH